MFPRKSNEAIFGEPLILFEQSYVMDDQLAADANKGKRKINEDGESKKSVPKDIEKQRRQQMAALCASLRSLLPLQYIKGKRAVCDHMEQAVNYIKDTQNKIEELKMRRNKLVDAQHDKYWGDDDDGVKINLLRDDEMEILITTNHDECFSLSKVLAYLLELGGLHVTTYVSTTAHQYFFHKLHIQVNEMISIDVSELKQMLVNLIRVA